MMFSIPALVTMIFFSSILIALIYFILRSNRMIEQIGMKTLAFCMGAITLRLLVPFELPISRNFPINKLFPEFMLFIKMPVIKLDGFTISLLQILFFIWTTGIIIQILRTAIIYYRFTRTVTNTFSIADEKIQRALHRVTINYNKPLSFQIIQTDIVSTPMVFSILKPKILLPKIELTEEEWYYILSHEVSHYHSGDLWIKFLVEILCIIYWWYPLVYLLRNQISKVQEIHIDLSVIKSMNEAERIKYLECLLKIAKIPTNPKLDKWILSFDGKGTNILSQRFHMILNYNIAFSAKRRNYLALLPVALMVAVSFILVLEPYSISPQDAKYTVELTDKDSYLIQNQEGGYDVYFNGQYYAHTNTLKDSFSDLPIYKNISEVHNNEKNK